MEDNLNKKLDSLARVFDLKKVMNLKTNKEYIKRYYLINKLPYSMLHTKTDLIYMGISRDGTYKENDLLEAARMVEKFLRKGKKERILELASGRGANSFYLAKRHPEKIFYGLDFSHGQLDYSFKKARKVKNYFPREGDYHDLSTFKDSSIEIIFIVEALCYSTNKEKVLKEAYRVLKKSGFVIIFDGYSKKRILKNNEKIALKLVEKGMALEKFELYKDFIFKVEKSGFKIKFEEDVSKYTLPTMERFEKLAKKFLYFPFLAKLVCKILPKEFVYNVVSAYLMPDLIKKEIASYMITILKK
ncbi:hypothetical protein COU54_05380 [Candidatus Pacearchaeota archaeon CG10_big_fil_rev_8_21_14_0_10_31_24]|nr:MAG: hypothetical protein COU54_05380 [Candidatus Pacearchaeota archaeon CG10_big_fil_rev_8_21_14_0_10_31_24]